jgi:hypothetical protein
LLGKAYLERKRPLKVNEYWSTLVKSGAAGVLDGMKSKAKG